jgi:uncharacterized protein (TIGR03437 family)
MRTLLYAVMVFPIAAWANVTGTQTLQSGPKLNLDTGAVSPSSGDLYWLTSGQIVAFAGATMASPPASVTAANFSSITQAQLLGYTYNQSVIYGPAPGSIFAVHTNGGNYAAVLVTAVAPDQSTITLQFITFTAPSISQVINNYSLVPSGFPNSGISPGSLFIIKGGSMASATTVSALQSSAAPGLPATLNGAGVSVTVNGTTVTPAFYYAISTQLALVLPSNTPVGAGTVTVTYNGQTSLPYNIQVVANAFGFAAYYGNGSGLGLSTNASNYALYNYTNSIPPGTTVVLYGSGLGADPARDTVYTPVAFSINSLAHIYVGGIDSSIFYQGASGYPGLNEIDVTIPAGATTGCHVPVVGVNAAGVPTNFITLPIGAGVCEDPASGLDGTMLSTLSAQAKVNAGSITVTVPLDGNGIPSSTVVSSTPVSFYAYTGAGFGAQPGIVSSGGCVANSIPYSTATNGLETGQIMVIGQNLLLEPSIAGTDSYALLPGTVGPGGSVTFQVESSAQVGGFTATVTIPSPSLNWTNQSAAITVTRSQGLDVTWTGGQTGTYVSISGFQGGLPNGANALFSCIAPVSAGQFTVPPYVFASLPNNSVTIGLANQTMAVTFSAAEIDYGYTQGFDGQTVTAALQ